MAEPYEAENRQIDKRPGARETGNAFDLLRMAEQQTPVSFHEQRMHHLLDQAAPDDQIFIAVHQLNSCPDAVVQGLSDHGRQRLVRVFGAVPEYQPARDGLLRLKRAVLGNGEFEPMGDIAHEQAFFEATAPLSCQAQAEKAAEFINAMNDTEMAGVMFMRPDTHLRMLKALQQADQLTPEINDARFVLHTSIDAGKPYYEEQARFRRTLVKTLMSDKTVQRGLQNWHRMDDTARIGLLQHVADVQNSLAGHQSATVVGKDIPPYNIEGKDVWLRGNYRAGGNITVNTQYKDFWNDPEQVIGTVVHENTHHHQHVLGTQYSRGRIEAGEANYMAGALFDDGINHGYVTSGSDAKRYRQQLVEKSARDTQNLVQRELKSLGLSYDADAERELREFLAMMDDPKPKAPDTDAGLQRRPKL